jgi:hypothetical protein
MKAILIAGREERHKEIIIEFEEFLHEDLGIKDTTILSTLDNSHKKLSSILKESKQEESVLIIYQGHGSILGWEKYYLYINLCWQFKRFTNQIFLVNDCCHSGAIIRYLEMFKINKNKFGLLASCEADSESVSEMVNLMDSWRCKNIYDPEDYIMREWPTIYVREGYSEKGEIVWESAQEVKQDMITTQEERRNAIRWGITFDPLIFNR